MTSRALLWSFLVFFLVSQVVYVTCHGNPGKKKHHGHDKHGKKHPHGNPGKKNPGHDKHGKKTPHPVKPGKKNPGPINPVPTKNPVPVNVGPTNNPGNPNCFKAGEWKHAHATHYEGGSGTFGGACGYHDVVQEGYGLETVALSNALFNKGEMCGACFEIKCTDSPQWCKPGNPSLIVTATNHCPPNYAQPADNGGWCNEPREHFDIARPVFETIAQYKAGIVPVTYRRVPCDHKKGGMKFTITGGPYFSEVLVWNVAGAGDVMNVEVQTDEHPEKWLPMKRMWGQRWVYNGKFCESQGALSFRVTSGDGRTVTSERVAPKGWQYGQTYEGKNFAV